LSPSPLCGRLCRTTSADKVKLIICCKICGETKKNGRCDVTSAFNTLMTTSGMSLYYVMSRTMQNLRRCVVETRERRAQKHKKKETETKPRDRRDQGNMQSGRRPAESRPHESTSTERPAAGGHRGSEGYLSGPPPVRA